MKIEKTKLKGRYFIQTRLYYNPNFIRGIKKIPSSDILTSFRIPDPIKFPRISFLIENVSFKRNLIAVYKNRYRFNVEIWFEDPYED